MHQASGTSERWKLAAVESSAARVPMCLSYQEALAAPSHEVELTVIEFRDGGLGVGG
jgi:hypothetical protein